MKYEDIEAEFNKFFEFPGADRSTVTSVSAKLFALYIAKQIQDRAEKLQAELDALNERIEKLKGWTDNQIPKAKSDLISIGASDREGQIEALETHLRFRNFADDWDAPGMEAYDDL